MVVRPPLAQRRAVAIVKDLVTHSAEVGVNVNDIGAYYIVIVTLDVSNVLVWIGLAFR